MGKPDPTTEREILALEGDLQDALVRGDAAWLDRVFVEDALFVHTDGRTERRSEFIERVRVHEAVSLSRTVADVAVRQYGDVAIVTGSSLITAIAGGERRTIDLRFTRVYVKSAGRWSFVTNQSGLNTFGRAAS